MRGSCKSMFLVINVQRIQLFRHVVPARVHTVNPTIQKKYGGVFYHMV